MLREPFMIRVGEAQGKGRGVFAQHRLRKGQVIERAPVVVIPAAEVKYIEKTVLNAYVYTWGPNNDCALALGLASIYNHSYEPNADFEKHLGEKVLVISALRDIEEGEEITINYNGPPEDQTAIWFQGAGWGWHLESECRV